MTDRALQGLASVLLAGACSNPLAAPDAVSEDGRWRVEGQGSNVVVLDGGRAVKTLPARRLGGNEDASAVAVRYLPARRSFVIAFDALAELWELSVDPNAPPVFDGLVHDYRMGEGVASPGFLGVRRTPLPAPVGALAVDANNNAHVLARSADAWWLVNLDIRRPITRFELAPNPELRRSQGDR
ncbi:MAG: hypothetical protein OEU94_09510 [Aquincola sp.]|nr:hypothetical protein [Aquincola sp.]MDH5329070.1 hypothetical protein [Aquincola sp.]